MKLDMVCCLDIVFVDGVLYFVFLSMDVFYTSVLLSCIYKI